MRFGGIVLTTLLVLGGCSSEPAPKEPAPEPTTPIPTVTASAPAMPAQARKDTPEGAAAFLKHYIDVFNYAAATGDVDELSRLSSPTCEGCQSYIKLYRDTYKAGGYFKGGDWKLSRVKVDFGGTESYIETHVTAREGEYKDSERSAVRRGNSEDSDVSFAVAKTDRSWRVTQLGLGATQ